MYVQFIFECGEIEETGMQSSAYTVVMAHIVYCSYGTHCIL